jgi:hypothetical protein
VPPRLLLCSHHLRMAVDVNLRINRDHVQTHCRGEKKKKKIKARQMNAGRGIEELARSRVVFARKVDAATHQLTVTLGTKMAAFDSFSPASPQLFCIFRSQRNILGKGYFFPRFVSLVVVVLMMFTESQSNYSTTGSSYWSGDQTCMHLTLGPTHANACQYLAVKRCVYCCERAGKNQPESNNSFPVNYSSSIIGAVAYVRACY